MKHHIQALQAVLKDLYSLQPEPTPDQRKVIKEYLKDRIQTLTIKRNGLNLALTAAQQELTENLQKLNNTESGKQNLREQVLRPSFTQANTSTIEARIAELNDGLNQINIKIHETLHTSREEVLKAHPILEQAYAHHYSRISMEESPLMTNARLQIFLDVNPRHENYRVLKNLGANLREMEEKLSQLKKDPETNTQAIITATDDFNKVAVSLNNEWERVHEEARSKKESLAIDQNQDKQGIIKPK